MCIPHSAHKSERHSVICHIHSLERSSYLSQTPICECHHKLCHMKRIGVHCAQPLPHFDSNAKRHSLTHADGFIAVSKTLWIKYANYLLVAGEPKHSATNQNESNRIHCKTRGPQTTDESHRMFRDQTVVCVSVCAECNDWPSASREWWETSSSRCTFMHLSNLYVWNIYCGLIWRMVSCRNCGYSK